MRTELNKKAKSNDEKIDGALRRVAHLSQRFDSELGGIESACSEFQEVTALLSHKVGTSCEDIQALDESMGHLKASLEGIAETTEMRSTQVADVHEELHQLEARLSVLSDQYSGTTEMYSTHMDQNTAITNQLVEQVEQCAVPAQLLEGMQAQLEDLRIEFESMEELTQQG